MVFNAGGLIVGAVTYSEPNTTETFTPDWIMPWLESEPNEGISRCVTWAYHFWIYENKYKPCTSCRGGYPDHQGTAQTG